MEYRITVDERKIRVEAFNHCFEVSRDQWRDMPADHMLDLTWDQIGEMIGKHLRHRYEQAEAGK
jgi:hypothetical protein